MAETKINESQTDSTIYTQSSLVAGKDISITLVPQPVIDEYTTRLCHFDDSVADAISGQSNWPSSTNTRYFAGKFGRARGESITSGLKSWTPAINFNVDRTLDFWVAPKNVDLSTTGSIELRTESSTTSSDNIFLVLNNPNGSTPTIQIGKIFSGTGALQTIQWPSTLSFVWGDFFHIAFEKDTTNGKAYLFVDGKKVWENVHTGNIGSSITIYARYSSTSIGSIEDEARISSVVRWTADFTPFSVPYAVSAGDPIYQINDTKDISGKQDLLSTATGYDATKTQVLKNVAGTLTWVDEA